MSQFEIRLFGAPGILLDGEPLKSIRRKALALLAYLALEPRPVRRETLSALLWPEYSPEQASAYLRRAVWELRQALGQDCLEGEGDELAFIAERRAGVDVQRFRTLLHSARDAGAQAAQALLEQAVSLYHGHFMAGFSLPDSPGFDEWQLFQTEALRREQAAALEQLSLGFESVQNLADALEYARLWLELDLLNEAAHRRLMAIYARMGQRSAALRQYELCKEALWQQLSVRPQPETRQLYEAIRRGEFAAEAVGAPVLFSPGQPAPAAPSRRVNKFPSELSPFLGREQELADIQRILREPSARLVTLVGLGGIGKTRLAVRAGSLLGEDEAFPAGACFVPLAGLSDAAGLPHALAKTLDLPRQDESSDPLRQISEHLRGKQMLLVLDNFEHLLGERSVGMVLELISACQGLKLLVTSRAALNIRGEQLYPVHGMAVPDGVGEGVPDGNGAGPALSRDELEAFSAVSLFLECLRRVKPGYQPDSASLSAIVEACRLVQGMPLAIELAAAWGKLLSPVEIVAELRRSLDFLESDQRDLPERQRSIRAVFNTTWELLSEPEQSALMKLTVFKSGFSRQAAQQVAGATLQILASLLDKSLLHHSIDERYDLHELLRQYAAEQMREDTAAWFEIRNRHSTYFMNLLIQGEHDLRGSRQFAALAEIDREQDNLHAAWMWQVLNEDYENIDRSLLGLSVYISWASWVGGFNSPLDAAIEAIESKERSSNFEKLLLAKLYVIRSGSYTDYTTSRPAQFNRRAFDLVQETGAGEELGLWYAILANSYGWRVEPEEGIRMLRKSLAHLRQHGDEWEIGFVERSLGSLLWNTDQRDEGYQLMLSAEGICREQKDLLSLTYVLAELGFFANQRGDLELALTYLDEARQILEQSGYRNLESLIYENMGQIHLAQGNYAEAADWFYKCADYHRQRGQLNLVASNLSWVSMALLRSGEYIRARQEREVSLALAEQTNDITSLSWGYFELGEIERITGDHAAARQAYEKGLRLFGENRFFNLQTFYYRALGQIALAEGDYALARQCFNQALENARHSYHNWSLAYIDACLAQVNIAEGRLVEARQHLGQSLETAVFTGDLPLSFLPLCGFASLQGARGEAEEALRLAAFVQHSRASWAEIKGQAERIAAQAEASLTAEAAQAARKSGESWTWEQVVERCRELVHQG